MNVNCKGKNGNISTPYFPGLYVNVPISSKFVAQLPQCTIYTRYLGSGDMEPLVSDTSDHFFKEYAKSKGDVMPEKCSISPIEDQCTDLHTSFLHGALAVYSIGSLLLQKEPTVGSGFDDCDVIDFLKGRFSINSDIS
jgi:hypothetical protein